MRPDRTGDVIARDRERPCRRQRRVHGADDAVVEDHVPLRLVTGDDAAPAHRECVLASGKPCRAGVCGAAEVVDSIPESKRGATMIDHTAVNVTDLAGAKSFYGKALEPLGYSLMFEVGDYLGFGDRAPNFGVVRRDPVGGGHVAFASPDRATVDRFYEAAVAAGGKDNGPPGLRPHYHESYYAAFVHDADGNNIEAVCQQPE
jgi:catechol 2,3-dioxygenase-like lactoylglutathione lyase family enzyme